MRYLLLLIVFCGVGSASAQMIIGHRGARAVLPENSLPGFEEAVRQQVDGIEMDLVLSKDDQVIISHEPWFSHKICKDPDGNPISGSDDRQHNIRELSAKTIAKYDCGCIGHPSFPTQKAVSVHKPTLAEAVQAIDEAADGPAPTYFLEIKSRESWKPEFQPDQGYIAKIVYMQLGALKLKERSIIMSFDKKILQDLHRIDSSLSYLLLIADPRGVEKQIDMLGFTPDYIAPHFKLLGKRKVRKAHERGIKVAVWTVNKEKHFRKMQKLGVDAIITDDPALGRELIPLIPSSIR